MLTRWDPFSEMNRLHNELFGPSSAAKVRDFQPAVDIREDDDAFRVFAELAGLKADDVDIDIEKNVLTLSGEKKFSSESEQKGLRRVERSYGRFARSFALPDTVDADSISAEMRDGILTLTLPKRPAPGGRKVPVQVS